MLSVLSRRVFSRFILLCLGVLVLLVPFFGCGGEEGEAVSYPILDVTAVDTAEGPDRGQGYGTGSFYPLDIGDTWLYEGQMSFYIEGDEAGVSVNYFTQSSEIVGTDEQFGRDYMLERRSIQESIPGDVIQWIRYRQDGRGLYEADVSIYLPPGGDIDTPGMAMDLSESRSLKWERMSLEVAGSAGSTRTGALEDARIRLLEKIRIVDELFNRAGSDRSPERGKKGGVLPDEITRLRYPLRPGQEWVIRDDPYFGSVVVCNDILDLPAGMIRCWKIEVTSSFFEENDKVFLWYGRDGLIRSFAHLESISMDPSGNPGNTLVSEEDLYLVEFDIAGAGSPGEKIPDVPVVSRLP